MIKLMPKTQALVWADTRKKQKCALTLKPSLRVTSTVSIEEATECDEIWQQCK